MSPALPRPVIMKMISYLQLRTQQWCVRSALKTHSLTILDGKAIEVVKKFLHHRSTILELQFSNGVNTAKIFLNQTDEENTMVEASVVFGDEGKTESIQLYSSEVEELLYKLHQLVESDEGRLERLDQRLTEVLGKC